jgi:cobalt-zinc-cadmium efflux system outer membrane protein
MRRKSNGFLKWCASLLVGAAMFGPALLPAAEPPMAGGPAAETESDATARLLSLTDLEQMALRGNPTLGQAAANVEIAHGRTVQSGLCPNPTVGYVGERIGAAGTAGEMQGVFIDQTLVTARKLRLNRAKFAWEVTQAEALALAQQYRVVNGVRVRYYQLLAMQRLLDVRGELLKVAEAAVTTTEELVNVGAANRPDLLQARIEARQERVALDNARTLYRAAWQQLAAFVGEPCLPPGRLAGELEGAATALDFDTILAHLLEASPEVQIARAEVERSRIGLKREQVEPIPNVQVQVANGYDFETRNDTTSVQIGVRLPIFDKNQGNIRAAHAQLARAAAEVQRVELSLRQRLSRQYARYRTASALVEAYREATLPEAREAYELYLESFRKRRAAWPQVLVAQRTYFQISVDYVQALEELRRSEVALLGLLLVDGMDEPPTPGEGMPRRSRDEGAGDLPDPIDPRGGRGIQDRSGAVPEG